jgi:hypothetical protein
MSLRARAGLLAAVMLATVSAGCSNRLFGKQYEYEEDLTLALDGSATLVVNTSLAALAALRGLDLDLNPRARIDRDREKIRAAYQSPVTEVQRVSRPWTRAGRRFVQVRIKIHDIRKLAEVPPLAWSRYELTEAGGHHVFRQRVGPSALRAGTLRSVGWNGSEIVAFRLHLPSKIIFHNSRDLETNTPRDAARGNILGWEQHLADRLDGAPLDIQVQMESQSILYRTLWLFGGAFLAAMASLALLIWLTMRKGAKETATIPGP